MSAGPHILLKGVEKSFEDGRIRALRGIDLEIERGTILVILGPSGSGKSTLLSVIGALERPDRGEVRIGEALLWKGGNMARIRAREIGFVFQLYNLIPVLDPVENVELPMLGQGRSRRERRERAVELLRRFGLGERLRTQVRRLSGGERQRVALVRALANDPPLLLADEPTGALDRENGRLLLGELENLARAQGKTVVIVTHDPEVAQIADRRIRIVDGTLVAPQG